MRFLLFLGIELDAGDAGISMGMIRRRTLIPSSDSRSVFRGLLVNS